jgi:ST7 protein
MDSVLRSVNTVDMADFLRKMFAKLKIWIAWLWTYLWALWFLLVVFVVYILRGPLRIGENITSGKAASLHTLSQYYFLCLDNSFLIP